MQMNQSSDSFKGSRYWTGVAYVLFGIPIIVYIWVVLIGRYSMYVGIVLAIASFAVVLFVIIKIQRWLKNRKTLSENEKNRPFEPQ